MNAESTAITLWNTSEPVVIPATLSELDEIVRFAAPTLSTRDMKAIVSGFRSESFEMVATFVWTKAAATLKKQLASLGMEFVGEMLGRPDLTDDSDPTSVGDHEAIALAEDLGMITPTQGLRLKHAMELVTHFANLEPNLEHEQTDDDGMGAEEALSLLKTCISSILGKPRFEAAIYFADFRRTLAERSLQPGDNEVQTIKNAAHFFVRTTISVLLSMIKSSKGAALEHSVGNTILLIPMLWDRLRSPERWQVGQAYAEVNAAGNRVATTGLKKALVAVQGFDYVPESLRSNTFTETAARVLSAHFGLNNFQNEPEPMSNLANLGTTIPKPAFAKCMEATLAVWLGNHWGYSWNSRPFADKLLQSLRREQWEYYVNECLPRDRTVLDKLSSSSSQVGWWKQLVATYDLASIMIREKPLRLFMTASADSTCPVPTLMTRASDLREHVTS
jgi:hypothetical protein